jgi:ADP-ribose pyrophosphatase
MEPERPISEQPLPPHAKKVFAGVMFDVYQWEQEMYDGSTATFEKLKRPDTVVVFPVLDDGRILLTVQEQPGKAPFIGSAGGRVDAGEGILEAVKRELLEETGYEASEYTLWHAEQPTSKIEWAVFLFVAKGLKKVADLNLDAGEKITLKSVTFDEFVEIATGDDNFVEREIIPLLLKAKLDPAKMADLRNFFKPNFTTGKI